MKGLEFRPKLFTMMKTYTKADFMTDLMAGIIVGIVALPLAIAFGIASGVSPEKGIITAIVAGFIISFLGGSKVQIGGPTGAFIVIIYGIIQEYGIDGLMVATMMAGVLLILLGIYAMIRRHFIGGIILFLAGVYFLIGGLSWLPENSQAMVWPLALIIAGVLFIFTPG